MYRQWKALGEGGSNTSEGIALQCRRLNFAFEGLAKASNDGHELILGGDLNINRHTQNDPCSRPDLKALTPYLEDFMMTHNMTQINHRPTRHQIGSKSSLLDLFLSNIPQRITTTENVLNTLSEHKGVKICLHTKTEIKQPKSSIFRDYKNATFNIMQLIIDKSDELQSLFADLDPDVISKKLVSGMKDVTDLVVTKRRIQTRKRKDEFWTKELQQERNKLKELNAKQIGMRDPEDIRMYKNFKNRHTKNIQ